MLPLAAIPIAIQGVTGLAQMIKGRKLAQENVRPGYDIPDEVRQNLSQAQMQALEGLPAEVKNQYLQNLQRSSQFGLSAMGSRKAGLAGLSSLVQNQNDAYSNLMAQDAQAQQANLQELMNQRATMAGYKDKQFGLNQFDPYTQKAEAAQAMKGSGMQNIMGALQSGADLGLAGLSGTGNKYNYRNILNKQKEYTEGKLSNFTPDENVYDVVNNQPYV